MLLHEFLLLATAHWLALVSPGPDFLLLLRNALRHGRRNGIGTSLGIACANGMYILLALAGFSILQHSALLLAAMKLLAGVYLGYIGYAFMRSGRRGVSANWDVHAGAQAARGSGFLAGMVAGFLSGGLNPKNGLFYLGLFTLLVDVATSMQHKVLYGIWMFAAVFLWDAALVLAISNARVAACCKRHLARAEWWAGALLLGLALAIVLAALLAMLAQASA